MMDKKILLAYDSLSGNTKSVADIIFNHLIERGVCKKNITLIHTTLKNYNTINLSNSYDFVIIGTWTSGRGRVPPSMKNFFKLLIDNNIINAHNSLFFGTGESQFGEEYYCKACINMSNYIKCEYPYLLIEQYPHDNDINKITDWIDNKIKKAG